MERCCNAELLSQQRIAAQFSTDCHFDGAGPQSMCVTGHMHHASCQSAALQGHKSNRCHSRQVGLVQVLCNSLRPDAPALQMMCPEAPCTVNRPRF